jgi:hypothetical protein|tara:strand:+ start:699 stop:938 length:240 start_codon:yes stop_codon:yes gene_type:complete
MPVDRNQLVTSLQQHGTVVFCDINNDHSYVVVMNNWDTNIEVFQDIVNVYVIPYYPYEITLTLVEGTIKSQFNKSPSTF